MKNYPYETFTFTIEGMAMVDAMDVEEAKAEIVEALDQVLSNYEIREVR